MGLLITGNCCLRCGTCTYWKERKTDLSLKQLKLIVDKCAAFGIKNMCLTGGEPLLRKDVTELADYIRSKGINLSMITNAWLFKSGIGDHFNDITVSVDGARPQTHDKIRGVKGSWDRCMQALKDPKVMHVNFVVQKDNYKEIGKMCDIVNSLGKTMTLFFYCDSGDLGQPEDNAPRLMNAVQLKRQIELAKKQYVRNSRYYDYCYNKWLKGSPKKQPCVSVYFKFMVDEKGNVYPCSHFNKSVGNLLKQDMSEIWASYRDLRKTIRKGNYDFCRDCYSTELNCNFVTSFTEYPKMLLKTAVDDFKRKVTSRKR